MLLWEFDPAGGLRLTRPVDDPRPLAEYLEVQGKYRHLSPEQIAHIEAGIVAAGGVHQGPGRQGCAVRRYRIRLNHSSESSADSSAIAAAPAANSAEISVSFCSKNSLVLRLV